MLCHMAPPNKSRNGKSSAEALALTDSADAMDLIAKVRKGLPLSALVELAKELDVSIDAAAVLVGIAPRTLARRKLARSLDPLESERVNRVSLAVKRAKAVLGTLEKARAWLKKDNRALGSVTPLSLMDTDMGARAVDDVLGRIEYGVFG